MQASKLASLSILPLTLGKAIQNASMEIIEEGYAEAKRRSSGTFSLAELSAMDHPYARRHPSPLLDPSWINYQTGDFYEAWRRAYTSQGGRIINEDPKADGLKHGTTFMVERPVDIAIEDHMRESAEAIVKEEIQKLFS